MKTRKISARLRLAVAMTAIGLLAAAPQAQALALLVPTDTRFGPLELESQVMQVKVDNQTAQTRIKQVFHNRYGSQIEAIYLMPIPKGAHVTDFAMEMNGKKVHGEVLEKEKARKIYTDIVRRMRDPGLLEYVDQNVFRARIFPIPPRGHQKVEITITHLLPQENGIVEYQWPFEAPKAVQARGRPTSPDEFDVKLDIKSKKSIKAVYSPTHKVRVKHEDKHHAVVRLDEIPKHDEPIFRCYYTLSNKGVGLHALTTREEGHDGTFLLMISPGEFYEKGKLPPVDFTFVVDTSGSMGHDDKMAAAKKALVQCLNALRKDDAFNIIRFSTEVEPFSKKFLKANEDNLKRAKNFIEDLRPTGGTNIDGALEAALSAKPREGRLHTVLFMTDGKPTIGERNVDTILKNVEKRNEAGLRVFACGVGFDVNTKLIDRLAEKTRSAVEYIRPKQDLEVAISNLFKKISHPVLTNLELDWGDLEVKHVYPKKLPDLFAGTQLTVFGRYKNGGDEAITLTGKVGDAKKKFTYEASFKKKAHETHEFIKTLWATRRVGYLLTQIRDHGESTEVREEVVRLAKRYGIVTPYTSYLVQEDGEVRQGREVAMTRTLRRTPTRTYSPDRRLGEADRAEGSSAFGMAGPARGSGGRPATDGFGDLGARSRGGSSSGRTSQSGSAVRGKAAPSLSITAPAESSGEAAVKYSEHLRELKRADATGVAIVGAGGTASAAGYKVVAGKTFRFANGNWAQARDKDDADEAKKPKTTLKIKYLGDAYFALLKLRPDLKKIFALGEKVEFDVNDFHIVIGPEGKDKLTRGELDKLAKKK